jgi:hypothetical protein
MVTTDKVQGMQRKVVLVTVGVIALALVAVKLLVTVNPPSIQGITAAR